MYFKKNNKVDEITQAVVRAIKAKRFNYARYADGKNKFRKVFLKTSETDKDYVIDVYDDNGNVAHTIRVAKNLRKLVFVDGNLYEEMIQADAKEAREIRRELITPMIDKIENRVREILEKIDSDDMFQLYTANLLEYCADPHRTAIGAGYSYNRGSLARLLANKLTEHAMRCDEGNGIYTLKQVCKMIDDGEM